MTNYKTACVFGGSGFIGRHVVRELAKAGYRVKVASRIPESAFFLKPYGMVGQIVPVACRYSDEADIKNVVRGCDVVVNCVGILYERRKNDFQKVHCDIPAVIAKACTQEGVSRFVHISALGCDTGRSKYAQSKRAGEDALLQNYPKATILRPSVVFGEDDNFFNMFAKLAGVLPFLPLIGGGKTKFQPVYVGDVADAVIKAVQGPAKGENSPLGQIYELGGPDVVSFKEIYEILFDMTHRRTGLLPIPFPLAKVQGFFMGLLPSPLLTVDQVESLKTDNVVQDGALCLENLGVSPTAMACILPEYLERYRPGGRFSRAAKA